MFDSEVGEDTQLETVHSKAGNPEGRDREDAEEDTPWD